MFKVLLHNVIEKLKPELVGVFSAIVGFIFGMDMITVINGLLQSLVLLCSVAVSIITFLYIRDKRKNLNKEP